MLISATIAVVYQVVDDCSERAYSPRFYYREWENEGSLTLLLARAQLKFGKQSRIIRSIFMMKTLQTALILID